jgi:hypothetical protein
MPPSAMRCAFQPRRRSMRFSPPPCGDYISASPFMPENTRAASQISASQPRVFRHEFHRRASFTTICRQLITA